MKTKTLYKRLSLPLLLTVISATGIGVSSPARSASLLGSQSTAIDAKPEAILIADCYPRMNCNHPSRILIEKPEIEKPEIEKPSEQRQRKIEQQQQQRQREIEQQQQQRQREIEQQQQQRQPIVEPAPNAEP